MIGFANFAWSDVIPSGIIIMWHGLLANIPVGWALCDGTNGTPDLRDRYLKGSAVSTNPGSTGGANTHTHAEHASQSHSGAAVGNHASFSHSGAAVADHTEGTAGVVSPGYGAGSRKTHSVTQADTHPALTHTVSAQATSHDAESHDTPNHEPAYYTVAFLRKK